jgi:hypothetical protein
VNNGLIWMRRGYVISNGGRLFVTVKVTDNNAKVVPIAKRRVEIKPLVGQAKAFETLGDVMTVSAHIEEEYVLERWTARELEDFLATGKAAPRERSSAAGNNTNEGNNTMKKNGSSKKTTTPAEPKGQRVGGLGEWNGHSIGSIIKRLGMADVTAAHAREIMKALGADKKAASAETFANTVAWNITAGKSGRGKVADITKAQVDELKAMAPEPAPEPKAEPKPKAKKGGKKGGKKNASKAKGPAAIGDPKIEEPAVQTAAA